MIISSLYNRFSFQIKLAYLKWHYICVYHTSVMYSWLALRFLRGSIIWLFFLTFVIMLCVWWSKHLFLCIITPRLLYFNVISYPSIYLSILFSHYVYCILFSIIIILDFCLFIFILFISAHFSPICMVFYSFTNSYPSILVSSAKIYGDIFPSFRYSSVRSLVNILNRRHDMLHPYPSPLPEWISSYFVGMVRLLNISCTPYMTSSFIFIFFIFSKRIY